MIFEIIIIVSVIVVFVILARRLPDLIKKQDNQKVDNQKQEIVPQTPKIEQNPKPAQSFWSTVKKVEKVENKVPEKEKSNFEKGDMNFKSGNYKEAEKCYIKAASSDPNNPKIYNRLGIIYLEQKNYRDAKDAFSEVLKFDDKIASRHVNYGLACIQLKNFDEGIKAYEKAAKLEPKNKKYQELLRDIKAKKKLFEKK